MHNTSTENEQRRSKPLTKQSLLQQARGSMVNIEKLTEENFAAVASKGLSFQRTKELFENAGLDIEKVIVDPTCCIYNAYYADYENGVYLDLHMQGDCLTDKRCGLPTVKERIKHAQELMTQKQWCSFYLITVPGPLHIYDFQRRYKDIDPDMVYEVWEHIHKNLDCENGQWRDEVLDYVFDRAPKSESLPINENGMVTVYRGAGTLSQPPEHALSWSTNQQNAYIIILQNDGRIHPAAICFCLLPELRRSPMTS